MNKKTKLLTVASCLGLIARPFLYIGGKSDSTGLIMLGFAIFCLGMGMAPVLHFIAKAGVEKSPPPDEKPAS